MISIVSCFNDINIVNTMLISGLEKQNVSYEIILQDNSNNKFRSAAEALNDGVRRATGDIIMIVHQDVVIGEFQLEKIINQINNLGDNAIVGAAGVKDSTGVYTNIKHGKDKNYAGEHRLTEALKVQTLDEVMIAFKRSIFEKLSFDEKVCDDWHLYGVDFCLSGYLKNINSYVIPVDLYHKSTGVLTQGYYHSLIKVVEKHSNEFDKIYTTCSIVSTSYFKSRIYVFLSKLKPHIKNLLQRKLKKFKNTDCKN